MNRLRFVFFTNEKNIHLIELTLKYFFKHNTFNNVKVSVIVNNIKTNELPYKDKVEYLNGNTEFHPTGGHFAKSLINCLPLINEKYVFLFLDDYFFAADTKVIQLKEVLDLIECENIDYFGFEDMAIGSINPDKSFETNSADVGKGHLFYKENQYRYLYSLQPTIWKKSSLINLVNKFPNMSQHQMDETSQEAKDNNTLVCLCNDLVSFVNNTDLKLSNYFCIAYYEIVRNGTFFVPENGYENSHSTSPHVQFTYRLIDEENLRTNNKFKKILHNIK